MSKASLKKLLSTMDREQLIELILDAYSARKETKEYLEFFLNPDVEKLLTKYKEAAIKELRRTKRGGYSKGRISFIRNLYKELCAFQPGYKAQMEYLLYLIRAFLAVEMFVDFSDTLLRGAVRLMTELIEVADQNQEADSVIADLNAMFGNEKSGTRYFRRYLDKELKEFLRGYKPTPAGGR